MRDKEDTSLVPRPSDDLARVPPGVSAIIDGMVNDATTLIRSRDAIRHGVGYYEFRESDYQQILIWAKATDLQPEELLGGMVLIVSDGAIVELEWHHLYDFCLRAIHQCKRRPPFGRLRVSGTGPLPSGLAFVRSLSKHEREGTTIKWNPY